MESTLTPFQLWSLFLMFDNFSNEYSSRDLLLTCCDSAIKRLAKGEASTELASLLSAGYIQRNRPGSIFDPAPKKYQISEDGILFVRKNLSFVQDACNQGIIPEHVIGSQDDGIAKALRDKSLENAKILIEHGINNIGPILALIDASKRALGAA